MRRLFLVGVALAFLAGVAVGGCGGGPIPVVDRPDGPPPPPVVDPPPADVAGSIDVATFDAIELGWTQIQVVGKAGAPYQERETGGVRILLYPFKGENALAWIVLKDGRVVSKERKT